jgi:hypothetical protein
MQVTDWHDLEAIEAAVKAHGVLSVGCIDVPIKAV